MKIKAFTLIELLIVIAVLGILVALILPRFTDVQADANTKVCIANLRGLASAMAIYETRANTSGNWGTLPWTVANLKVWDYLTAIPYCPYETGTSKAGYTLSPNPDKAGCPNVTTYTDHTWGD